MKLTRRYFLKGSGIAVASLGVAPLGQARARRPGVKPPVLIVLYLRGGLDGLSMLVPFGDPCYARLRGPLAIAAPGREEGALDLDGYFGLHPRAEPLLKHFRTGLGAAFCAVGQNEVGRSHFEAQQAWDSGSARRLHPVDSWLQRHLQSTGGQDPVRAISLGGRLVTKRRLSELRAKSIPSKESATNRRVALLDGKGRPIATLAPMSAVIAAEAEQMLPSREPMEALRALLAQPLHDTHGYPETDLGLRLQLAGRLIHASLGVEVITIDSWGWDTHRNQGAGRSGAFADQAGSLSLALDAFVRDLGDRIQDALVLCVTEFGRTVTPNAFGGTDHGAGSCAFLLGGAVLQERSRRPRPVLGTWPGLGDDQLLEGSALRPTLDDRDVIASVLCSHLGNDDLAYVLPGHRTAAGILGAGEVRGESTIPPAMRPADSPRS